MYPSKGDLHIAPFTDDALFMEQTNKASFWYVKYIVVIYLYSIPIIYSLSACKCADKQHLIRSAMFNHSAIGELIVIGKLLCRQ